MSDWHPSDDDENWFARERAITSRDSSRTRAATRIAHVVAAPSDESDAAYLGLVERREQLRKDASVRLRAEVDQMAVLIRELKRQDRPREARHLTEEITRLGHPDLRGLLETLEAKARAAADKGRGPARKDKPL